MVSHTDYERGLVILDEVALSIQDGIVMVNEEGRIVFWSKGEELITGIDKTYAVGKYIWEIQYELIPKKGRISRETFYDSVRNHVLIGLAERNKFRRVLEDTIELADGQTKVLQSLLYPIFDEDKIFGLGISRDITKQKSHENDLIRISELKSIILRDVAHDLRQPVTSMRLASGAIRQKIGTDIESKSLSRMFELIDMALKSFESGINSILELSKLQSLDQISREDIELNEMIRTAIYGLGDMAAEKGISLYFKPGRSLHIGANRCMISSLLLNLISNAIKYTIKGSITISADEDDETAKITVRDTGIGIGQEDLAKIFEPYFRSSQRGDGLGIGLAICKRIADLHNAKITIESESGKGTIVTVAFPRQH